MRRNEYRRKLLRAIARRDMNQVEKLFQHENLISHNSVAYAVVQTCSVEMVDLFLGNLYDRIESGGYDRIKVGARILKTAIQHRKKNLVQRILQNHCLIQDLGNNHSIYRQNMFFAADCGVGYILKLLLECCEIADSADVEQILLYTDARFNLSVVDALLNYINSRTKQPFFRDNRPIHDAFNSGCVQILDRLLLDPMFDTMSDDMPNLNKARMIRSRTTDVCIGLQDLGLPALITLEILDALMPNSIPMYNKWNLITKIKHFKTN